MDSDQIERYARHLVLKEIGGAGQNALLNAHIAIIGAGGLGGPAALYLAAAGVGHLTLIDDDAVSLSNLQRQIQFKTKHVGHSKIGALAQQLKDINPDTKTTLIEKRLNADNAGALLGKPELILDGTDSFATRFAINDAALLQAIPLLSGAVGRFEAQVSLFGVPGPCYRCLVPDLPPQEETCAEVGIVGALTGIVGSVMALEAIKKIAGAGRSLSGRLWVHDGLTMQSRTIELPIDPHCPACHAYR